MTFGFAQRFPGNDPVHLFQKDFLAGLFAVFLEIIAGKTLLAHRSLAAWLVDWFSVLSQIWGINQSVLSFRGRVAVIFMLFHLF